jgi:cytidylate kinase
LALDFLHNSDSGQSELYINNKNVEPFIRKSKVASWVSKVATISEVRRFLVKEQRKMADVGGVVMDGRDIASVVLPKAELKIFMTASPEIRAERRFQELIQKEGSEGLSLEDIAGNLKERDFLDSTREDSPLIQTVDARLLDNSKLTMDQQLDIAHNWVKEYGV